MKEYFRKQVLPELCAQTKHVYFMLNAHTSVTKTIPLLEPKPHGMVRNWPISEGMTYFKSMDDGWVMDTRKDDYNFYRDTAKLCMQIQAKNQHLRAWLYEICTELQQTREALLEAHYRPGGQGFDVAMRDFQTRVAK